MPDGYWKVFWAGGGGEVLGLDKVEPGGEVWGVFELFDEGGDLFSALGEEGADEGAGLGVEGVGFGELF